MTLKSKFISIILVVIIISSSQVSLEHSMSGTPRFSREEVGKQVNNYNSLSKENSVDNSGLNNFLEGNGENSEIFGEKIYGSINESLADFNPEIQVDGDYKSEVSRNNLLDENTTLMLPGEGIYGISGNVSQLESQYIENGNAEENKAFYSDNALQAGLPLKRQEDNRSQEGNHVWKFYSSGIDSMVYALYQEDINFYDNDTTINYSFLLESNSTMQNIVNSSLIFDFVFDTCRIMVIHWYKTNIDPPLIGENTTVPFVVFRLFKNSTWDDQWNTYSLSLSDLFDSNDPYIPNSLKSVGIYALSPEVSECSLLVDSFEIKTSVDPNKIDLQTNSHRIITTGKNTGTFNFTTVMDNDTYVFSWAYNSTYEVYGYYDFLVSGLVSLTYNHKLSIIDEDYIYFSLEIIELSSMIQAINITYPKFWVVNETNLDFVITLHNNITTTKSQIYLERVGSNNNASIEFQIENIIANIVFENNQIFETLNGVISFKQEITLIPINIFWFGIENGSRTIEVINNCLNFTFPSQVLNGNFDVYFIINKNNYFGFLQKTFELLRLPSQISTVESVELPMYSSIDISVIYFSLISEKNMDNSTVYAYINNELILGYYINNTFQLALSALYLSTGFYKLEIYGKSATHATAYKSINVSVSVSSIDITLGYRATPLPSTYELSFLVLSDLLPVAYAPLVIDINGETIESGVTNKTGQFSFVTEFISDAEVFEVSCSIIKAQNTILSKSFMVFVEKHQANIEKSNEKTILSTNLTLCYNITYSSSHNRWFAPIYQEMNPIFEAYIETDDFRIPVYWNDTFLFWDYHADIYTEHTLYIRTTGPESHISLEEDKNTIILHIVLSSEEKTFSDLSLLYYLNNTYTTKKFEWKLFLNKINDVTEHYDLEINDLYVYLAGINLLKGSILIFDLVGKKITRTNPMMSVFLPIASSSGVVLGALTAVIKIYNKKKGMILEI
ncbi:MAG: hypothetical protein ACTSSF_01535 [Candidatus Heimdallarchaeaceae archaeon]